MSTAPFKSLQELVEVTALTDDGRVMIIPPAAPPPSGGATVTPVDDTPVNVGLLDLKDYVLAQIQVQVDALEAKPGNGGFVAPITLTLTGPVTGQVSFDGSQDVAMVTALGPNAVDMSSVNGLSANLLALQQNIDTNSQAINTNKNDIAALQQAQARPQFVYDQAQASASWSVTHGLNKHPAVTVVDSAGTLVNCAIEYVDQNTVTIESAFAFAGQAFFN